MLSFASFFYLKTEKLFTSTNIVEKYIFFLIWHETVSHRDPSILHVGGVCNIRLIRFCYFIRNTITFFFHHQSPKGGWVDLVIILCYDMIQNWQLLMYTKSSSEFSRRICNKFIRTKLPFLSLPGLRISNLSKKIKKHQNFLKRTAGSGSQKKYLLPHSTGGSRIWSLKKKQWRLPSCRGNICFARNGIINRASLS